MDTNQCNDDGSCDLWESCDECEGFGYITEDEECPYCGGTGKHIFGQ